MATKLTPNQRAKLEAIALERGLLANKTDSLWPAPYNELSAESAYRFLTECVETEEESTGQAMRLPEKQYIRDYCQEWHECRREGRPMVCVKSRRLVVTWVSTALEVHTGGIAPGRILVGGRTYEGNNGSRAFVRRHAFIYRRLRIQFPGWKLKPAVESGNFLAGELNKVILPNGCAIEAVNSQGESFRGGGASVVRLEELSQWPNAAIAWSQAAIVVQGPPGQPGGFAYAVNNAAPNDEFLRIIERSA